MQVHFSYQNGTTNAQLEKIIENNVRKLSALLVRFSPDLIHLHGLVEFGTSKRGPVSSLNLWLPTARLHATEEGKEVPVVLRAAFAHIREQVKKHKQVLRREGEWKRKRYRAKRQEQKIQASEVSLKDRPQVREYLNLVLPQLNQFVARELSYRSLSGGPEATEHLQKAVVDEVITGTLEHYADLSGNAAPYHRLLERAIHVLDEKAMAGEERLGEKGADANVPATNSIDPVERCLAALPASKRYVYVLHALEGFSFDETAPLLGQTGDEVEKIFREVSQQVSAAISSHARNQ